MICKAGDNGTVDPVTNDLASARQKKSLVTESPGHRNEFLL